jgi:DNA-binding response OmpR family regulator
MPTMNTARPCILLVDDEPAIIELYKRILEPYDLLSAYSGREALDIVGRIQVDLVVLDYRMTGMDGLEVLRQVRSRQHQTPIVMVTALDQARPAVESLKMGACEYITKPFDNIVLIEVIENILRRTFFRAKDEVIASGSLVMNMTKRTVSVDAVPVRLTHKEYELLKLLLQHPGRLFSRGHLLTMVWGDDIETSCRTLDTHICMLRRKLRSEGKNISTIVNEGYKFDGKCCSLS